MATIKKLVTTLLMAAMVLTAQPLVAETVEPTGSAYQDSVCGCSSWPTFAAVLGFVVVVGGLILLLNHDSDSNAHSHS